LRKVSAVLVGMQLLLRDLAQFVVSIGRERNQRAAVDLLFNFKDATAMVIGEILSNGCGESGGGVLQFTFEGLTGKVVAAGRLVNAAQMVGADGLQNFAVLAVIAHRLIPPGLLWRGRRNKISHASSVPNSVWDGGKCRLRLQGLVG